MEKHKKCAFIGHRKIQSVEKMVERTRVVIERLITQKGVRIFLFGSRSEFNSLCLMIVTELRSKYADLQRIVYTCKGEGCILEKDKEKWQEIYLKRLPANELLLTVDEEYEHKTKYQAGKASYVERNRAMIDDCDYCVIYYEEDCEGERVNVGEKSKSGTKLAYEYIKKRKKPYVNVFIGKPLEIID